MSEHTPLVSGRVRAYTTGDIVSQHNARVRVTPVASRSIHDDNISIMTALHSIRDYVKERYPSLTTRKFIAAIIWSLVAVGIFNLIFLPRTSLGRDYRRIHFSTLSKDETERLFMKSLTDDNLSGGKVGEFMRLKHLSGDGDAMVQYTMDQLREYGLSPYKEVYYTWMPQHVSSSVSLLDGDNVLYAANLTEKVNGEDHPSFDFYSASGNVTAEFVYASYATREDYKALHGQGVAVKNKIHIVKRNVTSIQVKTAQEHGALGVVTYDDYLKRDTVLQYTSAPGDPTTVGRASTRAVKRDRPHNIPKIPTVPMSIAQITPILEHMSHGDGINSSLEGSSNYKIHLANHQRDAIRPMKNIMYEIPGLLPDKIIIGAHRDSTTSQGATDGSATAVLLEISRALGSLVQRGWKPMRTIVVASWDGSYPGQLGSTEYGEAHAQELQKHAIAYIDIGAVTGHDFDVKANPLLDNFLVSTSKLIPFNNNSEEQSLFDYWGDPRIGRLAAGGDHSVFQHHLGVPSCYAGFHGDVEYVNTINDTLTQLESVDPDFDYHGTLAKYLGFLALSLSEHEVIGYKAMDYATAINGYLRHAIMTSPYRSPKALIVMDRTRQSLQQLIEVSNHFDKTAQKLQEEMTVDFPWFKFYTKLKLAWDSKLMGSQAKDIDLLFLHAKLHGRPWMKHLVYAPDTETGECSFLPEIAEAKDEEHFIGALETLQNSVKKAIKRLRL